MKTDNPVISAFQAAAQHVPAYQRILAEANVDPAQICSMDDFHARVPVLDKASTFGRFGVAELCKGGNLGKLAGVLTSSGHSGQFAFGLYDIDSAESASRRIDDALDMTLGIRSRSTLLINCLPMGVKVYTRECTVAETSVRPDMVTALVGQFAQHYDQIILVGEAAFIKLVLELGQSQGINWADILVHVIVGEEPLAENARSYLETLLGIDPWRMETGSVGSSMGVAELGLNLFFELPHIIALRRMLHQDAAFRGKVLGDGSAGVGMLFTYDPSRIYIEVIENDQLVISTLDPQRPLPLIRYKTGDSATLMEPGLAAAVLGDDHVPATLANMPLIMIHGRGKFARAGERSVYPEQIKEGLYHDHELAGLITGNFRLSSGPKAAKVRIQLSPGAIAPEGVSDKFAKIICHYVTAEISVSCEQYETFVDGMALDYERKFAYMSDQ